VGRGGIKHALKHPFTLLLSELKKSIDVKTNVLVKEHKTINTTSNQFLTNVDSCCGPFGPVDT
jgi:hypothetical protein